MTVFTKQRLRRLLGYMVLAFFTSFFCEFLLAIINNILFSRNVFIFEVSLLAGFSGAVLVVLYAKLMHQFLDWWFVIYPLLSICFIVVWFVVLFSDLGKEFGLIKMLGFLIGLISAMILCFSTTNDLKQIDLDENQAMWKSFEDILKR